MLVIILPVIIVVIAICTVVITLSIVKNSEKKANYSKIQIKGGQAAQKDNNLSEPNLIQYEQRGEGTIMVRGGSYQNDNKENHAKNSVIY